MRIQRSFRGFTLIELLVVIAIIAILATLVLVQVESALVRSRNASAQSDVSEMGKTMEVYKSDQNLDNVIVETGALVTMGAASGSIPSGTVVPIYNLNGTSLCFGTAVSTGCTKLSTLFTGTEDATHYGTSITKTPSTSYLYGYETDSTGANYCVATNSVNASGVSGTVGFIINDGSSVQAALALPAYPAAAGTGKCS